MNPYLPRQICALIVALTIGIAVGSWWQYLITPIV